MSNRIRWEPTEYGGFGGYVGTLAPWVFQIYVPSVRDDRGWILQAQLPGALGKYVTSPDDPEALKAEAERWLEEFAVSLGAVFPAEHTEGPHRMIGRRLVRTCSCGKPWPCQQAPPPTTAGEKETTDGS